MDRLVVLVEPKFKAQIALRAAQYNISVGEMVRRSLDNYISEEEEVLLNRLLDDLQKSTAQTVKALDKALAHGKRMKKKWGIPS